MDGDLHVRVLRVLRVLQLYHADAALQGHRRARAAAGLVEEV